MGDGKITPVSSFQLESDIAENSQPQDILTEDVVPTFQEKDNDGMGDGEKEGCEERLDFIGGDEGATKGVIAALSVFGGVAMGVAGMALYKRQGTAPASMGSTDGVQMTKPKKGDWLKKGANHNEVI